jgi:heme-degrading monooxygenase HmoA
MIGRVWHGYTTFDDADTYEKLLRDEIFTGIRDRNIKGFNGIQLFRRELETETEFMTIMWFDSLGSVTEFAGNDYEVAVVPAKARQILTRFDERSKHYDVRISDFN